MARRAKRDVLTQHQHQAQAREAAMTALRAMRDPDRDPDDDDADAELLYEGFLYSLREQWSAVQIPPMSAVFVAVRDLEHVQREPHGADQYPGWGLRPSDELRAYLSTLDEIVAHELRLTDVDADTAAWWVKQDLHTDVINEAPRPWTERVDWWHAEAPEPAPEVRITTEGVGVRVTQHDPATGAHLWHHDPATGKLAPAWVFSEPDAALAFIKDTITQHYLAQGWQHNPTRKAKAFERDIPALMWWYVAGEAPSGEAPRRRLQGIARDVLMLNPPRKRRVSQGDFLADLAKRGG